jgi:hypothetical protein
MSEQRKQCEHCGRKLDEAKIAWLELSWKTGRWYLPGDCPEDESQGGFPFGQACAKAVLAEQSAIDQKHDAEYAS